jgi:hypothetical protein
MNIIALDELKLNEVPTYLLADVNIPTLMVASVAVTSESTI